MIHTLSGRGSKGKRYRSARPDWAAPPFSIGNALSPEFSLAVACAIWPPSDHRKEAIWAAATRPLDWERFLRVVRRHQVLGLVHDGLTRSQIDVPPEIAREISSLAAVQVRDNLIMAREAGRLQTLLDDSNQKALFLKGAALSLLVYGDLGLRGSKDIDLLVSREELSTASKVLESVGYRRFAPPPTVNETQLRGLMRLRKDLCYMHEKTGLRVDLHWRLILNPHAMNNASVVLGSQLVPLTSTTRLRTLGEEDMFCYLCWHGAIHWWNQLKWLADLGALLATEPKDGTERFACVAKARGAEQPAIQAMLLCQQLLGTAVPASIMSMYHESAKVRWLVQTALKAMTAGRDEREPRKVRLGTIRGSLSALLLGQGWRYWLSELHTLFVNENDILAVPLPERLRFLYPILRLPLWIWRHASQHNASSRAHRLLWFN